MTAEKLKEVEDKLIKRLSSLLSVDPKKIKTSAQLHSLGVDSLGFVELLVFIEKEFKIKLIESGMNKEDFKTIRSLAKRILKL